MHASLESTPVTPYKQDMAQVRRRRRRRVHDATEEAKDTKLRLIET
jgi:hypothetical protein